MQLEKYNYYLEKTHQDFEELLVSTQEKLDKSQSKGEDYYLLNVFWGKFTIKAIRKWNDSSTLFMDNESMSPMPESVAKQFVCQLFTIKHLDPLLDLPIYTGFDDYEFYCGSKRAIINGYNNEMFNDEDE